MNTGPVLPTQTTERIHSLDVLRGVAVLGILVINIVGFGMPIAFLKGPSNYGVFEGADVVTFWISFFVFEGSQRAVFSMLFGAGIILFCQRLQTDARAQFQQGLYLRRMLGLMLFGVIDAVLLLWYGDIIFLYGLVGLFLYLCRDISVRGSAITTLVLLVVSILVWGLIQFGTSQLEVIAEKAQMKVDQGVLITDFEHEALEMFAVDPAETAHEVAQRQAGYFAANQEIFPLILVYQLAFLPLSLLDVLSMMFLGMTLVKANILDGSRRTIVYLLMTIVGLGIGLTTNLYELQMVSNDGFDRAGLETTWTYHIGRVGVAIGITGLVFLFGKFGLLRKTQSCLAAVGRMALTNYLMQSLICLIFFVLLGYFGRLRLHELMYVVITIWFVQLCYSPLWLRYFRFGPLEWLWRCMTYRRWVEIRVRTLPTG